MLTFIYKKKTRTVRLLIIATELIFQLALAPDVYNVGLRC